MAGSGEDRAGGLRWAGNGRWVARMDSGFLKEEIHRFQIFSVEIIVFCGHS